MRFFVMVIVWFLALSVGLVIVYKFVPPPVTMTMILDDHGITKSWRSLSSIDRNMVDAAIAAEDGKFCSHNGFDRQAIEKAIMNSSLGLNPNNDGTRIRLNIPPLTTERRKEFVKQLAGKAEAARVALRNIRRDANDQLKKDEEVTDDDAKRAEKDVQKLLDKYIAELEAMAKAKEEELLEN